MSTSSRLTIQSLPAATAHATRLAACLGVSSHEISLHRFPDSELRVTVGPVSSTTVIYASLDRPDEKLLSILFAAEALRRNGAKRLILLAPYLAYMRQDTAFQPGEAISQKVVGRLLVGALDRIITVDAHLHRTRNIQDVFPGIEADNLSAMPAIAGSLRATGVPSNTIIIGPDAESQPWVSDLANRLGLQCTVARKTRLSDRSVEISFPEFATLKNRPALIVDDIVASGGTLMTCAKALVAAGVQSIDVVITHALFPAGLERDFHQAGIRSIRSTCSVPHPTNAIVLDQLFVAALQPEISSSTHSETTL